MNRMQTQESVGDVMTIKCPHCGTGYETGPASIGMSVVCETCRRSFIVRSTPIGGNKNMTTMNKSATTIGNEDVSRSHCGILNGQNIPLWICVGILLLNLITLVCICCMTYGNAVELTQTVAAIKKELSNIGEDISNTDGVLQAMRKEQSSMGKELSNIGKGMSNADSALSTINSKLESGETGVVIEGTRNSDGAIYRPISR